MTPDAVLTDYERAHVGYFVLDARRAPQDPSAWDRLHVYTDLLRQRGRSSSQIMDAIGQAPDPC